MEEATHIVVGVCYGAEVICVVPCDQPNGVERKTNEALLSTLSTYWKQSLEESQDVVKFEEKFDTCQQEKLRLTKCRLYTDFQMQEYFECNIFDAYKKCFNMIESVKNANQLKSDCALQIGVFLCPLQAITHPTSAAVYHDVDVNLVDRCRKIREKLERICIKVDSILAEVNCDRIGEFGDAVLKYQEILVSDLQNGIVKARKEANDEEVEKITNIVENHLLFKPSRLKRWLFFQQADLEIVKKMKADFNGAITVFVDEEEMKIKVAESKKSTLVLCIPSLNEQSWHTLDRMSEFVEKKTIFETVNHHYLDDFNEDGDTTEEEEEKAGIPYCKIQFKQKLMEDKIRELTDHIERNRDFESPIQFFILYGCRAFTRHSPCFYYSYEYSPNQDTMAERIFLTRLIDPTNTLSILLPSTGRAKRAKTASSSALVQWSCASDATHYQVEYRTKGGYEPWIQKRTTELFTNISFDQGKVMEIRVAAENFVGRSEFSAVIDTQSSTPGQRKESSSLVPRANLLGVLHPLSGLKTGIVTESTADLEWTLTTNPPVSFRIRYWLNGQNSSSAQEKTVYRESECCLSSLQPDTVYFVDVVCVEKGTSFRSDVIRFKTLAKDVRFVELMKDRCELIKTLEDVYLLAVPLKKTTELLTEYYVFGKHRWSYMNKTILLVGVAGSKKTALINALINYIFDVDWKDPFRFQLIPEVDGEDKIKVYQINHYSGFRVYCNLTIIDTPDYGDSEEENRGITKMINKFFTGGTKELDLIGFVVQSTQQCLSPTQLYVLNSLMSIFGKEFMENVRFLLTSGDRDDPLLLNSIADFGLHFEGNEVRHYKFDESAFFGPNGNVRDVCRGKTSRQLSCYLLKSSLWYMSLDNFDSFCFDLFRAWDKTLSSIERKGKEKMLNEPIRNQLETITKLYLMKLDETRQKIVFVTDHQMEIDANVNVKTEMEETVIKKVLLPFGQYATYCNKCCVTCHVCETENSDCDVMYRETCDYHRFCRVCPGRCSSSEHCELPYSEEYVQENKRTSTEAIVEMHEGYSQKRMTASELIEELEGCAEQYQNYLLNCVKVIGSCMPDCYGQPLKCINQLISKEKKEKGAGFRKRIKSLKSIRLLAYIDSFPGAGGRRLRN